MDDSAPVCDVCDHRHVQTDRCPLCGHYAGAPVQKRGPAPSTLHFTGTKMMTRTGAPSLRWGLCRVMRRTVFVDELRIPAEAEFDAADADARHILGQVGDAPASYVRWHVEHVGDHAFAFISRALVIAQYRRRGFFVATMAHVLEDISRVLKRRGVAVAGAMFDCPEIECVRRVLERAGFSVVSGPFSTRRGRFVRMVLAADPEASAAAGHVVFSPVLTSAHAGAGAADSAHAAADGSAAESAPDGAQVAAMTGSGAKVDSVGGRAEPP